MTWVVLMFFCGLSAGVIGKIKGSSFFIWFLIGAVLPLLGTIAALLYRFERNEPRRECDECGHIMPITNQVCRRCGADQSLPERVLVRG
jgi:Zn ribbon nucleic-acid-binding protein